MDFIGKRRLNTVHFDFFINTFFVNQFASHAPAKEPGRRRRGAGESPYTRSFTLLHLCTHVHTHTHTHTAHAHTHTLAHTHTVCVCVCVCVCTYTSPIRRPSRLRARQKKSSSSRYIRMEESRRGHFESLYSPLQHPRLLLPWPRLVPMARCKGP